MNPSTSMAAIALIAGTLAAPALADVIAFSGTRSNITPPASTDGRCGNGIFTVSMAPDAFAASGTSNLGSFAFTASHCVASMPPAPYYDGQFSWDYGDDQLHGTYTGVLSAGGAPGQFEIAETITFTGGSGRFAGARGSAMASGTVSFGSYQGSPATFGEVSFSGLLDVPAIPEPATLALWSAGGLLVAAAARRRRRSGGG